MAFVLQKSQGTNKGGGQTSLPFSLYCFSYLLYLPYKHHGIESFHYIYRGQHASVLTLISLCRALLLALRLVLTLVTYKASEDCLSYLSCQ
jgi:hypothetical protein